MGEIVNAELKVNKKRSYVAIVIFEVCEDWVKGSRYGILCGSESMMRVRAGRDVVLCGLKNRFLKALPREGGLSHREVVVKH